MTTVTEEGRRARTPEQEKAIAAHEAAHAVFCLSQGIGVKRLTIIPAEDYGGCCFPDHDPPKLPQDWQYWYEEDTAIQARVERALALGSSGPVGEAMAVGDDAISGEDGTVLASEIGRLWDTVLELFDPREAAVFEGWHRRWLGELIEANRSAWEALTGALIAERELDGAPVQAVVEAAGGVSLTPLPLWQTVRAQELATASPEVEFMMEGEEPVTVTVRLRPYTMELLQQEMDRLVETKPAWNSRRPDEIMSETLNQIIVWHDGLRRVHQRTFMPDIVEVEEES